MSFRYTNVTSGQVIDSPVELEHLAGLARWTREELPETAAAEAPSAPVKKPATRRTKRTSEDAPTGEVS